MNKLSSNVTYPNLLPHAGNPKAKTMFKNHFLHNMRQLLAPAGPANEIPDIFAKSH